MERPGQRLFEVDLSNEVLSWYARLAPRDRAYADRAFDRLASAGHDLRMPHSRALGDGLHELRFACEGVARRVTYAIGPGREVRALTTFAKQRSREPHELQRARREHARWRARGRGVELERS